MIVTLGSQRLHTKQGLCRVTYARGWMRMCVEFWDEILLGGGNVKPRENLIFRKSAKW